MNKRESGLDVAGYGRTRTVTDCHGLSRTVTDCHGLSRTVTDCHRLSQTGTGWHGFTQMNLRYPPRGHEGSESKSLKLKVLIYVVWFGLLLRLLIGSHRDAVDTETRRKEENFSL